MRALLLHPDDSPRHGPWAAQSWDLVVDLGRSSRFSAAAWQEKTQSPVIRSDSFRRGIEDARAVREMFRAGRGYLVDGEGIDWWDLTSLVVAPEAEAILVFQRLADEMGSVSELWATRPGWPTVVMEILLGCPLRSFGNKPVARSAARVLHYAGLLHRFPVAKVKEILLDKYDSGYRWRSQFAPRPKRGRVPLVLLPSAYGNVSRMAASYAQLLPDQRFLLLATRESATLGAPPPNVQVGHLASYAGFDPPTAETTSILDRWKALRSRLCVLRQFEIFAKAGVFDRFAGWFRDCLLARNAWRQVLQQEPIQGVLCGDDSNIYTRLPVMLAARRGIPTVDFHHGALDGRYVLKDLPCDIYLAKNQMERDYLLRVCGLPLEKVVIGAPSEGGPSSVRGTESVKRDSIFFFSEPYDVAGMRADEVYRELLPPLCRVASENGRRLVVKLHPFESLAQRKKILREVLPTRDRTIVSVIDGPLTPELMARAWFGITVESTTAIDCLRNGIACFLCGWLSLSPFGYAQQFARFGVGQALEDVQEILEIPHRLTSSRNLPLGKFDLSPVTDPAMLQRWLTIHEPSGERSVS